MQHNRRQFLAATGTAFAGLMLGSCTADRARLTAGSAGRANASPDAGLSILGALASDPEGLLDLPAGFSYQVVSSLGQTMDDGFRVPDHADGMGCFDLGNGEIALVRNHELVPEHDGGGVTGAAYDTFTNSAVPLPGGTTTLVLDSESLRLKRQYRTLAGTIRNCSGGITPWGSWLTCEETVDKANDQIGRNHGYVFEVPARASGLVDPVPLTAMGRFNHEAACIDPKTGIVYMTEDRDDSLLYRFVPNERSRLQRGGTLQALALEGVSDTRNWRGSKHTDIGQKIAGRWITLTDVDSTIDNLRKRGAAAGATLFARGEGAYMGEGEMYFAATSGGLAKQGQVFRLRLDTNAQQLDTLELFFESGDPDQYSFGDNLCVTPFGHLIVCEDQYTSVVNNHLRGITPEGASYPLAWLRRQTELAGACFSPDGRTLFVNAYSPTMTLAIRGPWPG